MKNNKTLKVACGLLVMVLLTTCVIGTTLARYTTADTASDSAQVAKWGVKLSISAGDIFDNEYTTDQTSSIGAVSVSSTTNLVAPGTNSGNQVDGSGNTIIAISGTPEVGVKLSTELSNVSDVYLAAGTYKDETTADPDDEFTITDAYYPVKFTLVQTHGSNGEYPTPVVVVSGGTLEDVRNALDYFSGTEYAPNTKLDARFVISWEWVIDGNSQADTVLGNLAAGNSENTLVAGSDYCLDVSYQLDVRAEQVD